MVRACTYNWMWCPWGEKGACVVGCTDSVVVPVACLARQRTVVDCGHARLRLDTPCMLRPPVRAVFPRAFHARVAARVAVNLLCRGWLGCILSAIPSACTGVTVRAHVGALRMQRRHGGVAYAAGGSTAGFLPQPRLLAHSATSRGQHKAAQQCTPNGILSKAVGVGHTCDHKYACSKASTCLEVSVK